MKFEIFKTILLSIGIGECEFYLRSSKKEGFLGYSADKGINKYCVVFDNEEFTFDKDVDVLNERFISNHTLEEMWDDIEINFINGFDDEEYLEYICTPNFYLNEYVAINKETNTLDVENLIHKMKKSEYNGNILLYAGTNELSEFSDSEKEYAYFIYDTFNKGIYLLKKEDNKITFKYLVDWYQRRKLKMTGLSIGRKYDKFSSKSGMNKSERYNLMLKFQRNQNLNIIGVIFGCLDMVSFFLLLCSVGLKSLYPKFVYCLLIVFAISMFFTFLFSGLHNKEWKKLNNILFPQKNQKIKFSNMFLEIQKEAKENGFHELYESLTHINKKIKKTGGFFESGTIDLYFNTKEHEFFIIFYNKFVLINIDEESINLEMKLRYTDFKDYYELESKIYSIIIEYL